MSIYFVLAAMLFMHVLDDYGLQSRCLSFLKQKDWWQKEAPQKLYRFDYIVALLMHGLSWSFMIMLPIAFALSFNINLSFLIMLGFNAILHAWIDDLKANRKRINLWVDQFCHLAQIAGTFYAFVAGGFGC